MGKQIYTYYHCCRLVVLLEGVLCGKVFNSSSHWKLLFGKKFCTPVVSVSGSCSWFEFYPVYKTTVMVFKSADMAPRLSHGNVIREVN